MQNLLNFIARHYHWLLFLVLEAVSVVMLTTHNSYQRSVWLSSANTVTGHVYGWIAEVEQFFSLTEANERLTEQNIELERQLAALLQAKADSVAATEKSGLIDSLQEFHLIGAKVVSNSVNTSENLITIDKGTKDGVKADMGVVCGTGIVGVVFLTGDHYSIVLPALNSRSRISCAIRGQGYFGYLSWNGGDPTRAYVEDIPRHAKLHKGAWIETSGFSSIFPAGVSVGQIEKIYNSRDGLSYRLLIKLSTDFTNLRYVSVISDTGLAERLRLMEAARDSMALRH